LTLGRFDDAIGEMKQAKELDPLTPLYASWFASLHQYQGRYPEMLAAGECTPSLATNS
jgi:hypothetical protein